MVQTAAILTDNMFPRVPVRQWVLSFPKRIRYFLHNDARVASDLLRIFLRALQTRLRQRSPVAPAKSGTGGVSFIHRFGSSLNPHTHFHCVVIDGVFAADQDARFFEAADLTQDDIRDLTMKIRKRTLAYMKRHGLMDSFDAEDMLQWEHDGGFFLDASVLIPDWDRAGLERLLRYCARPPVASTSVHLLEDNTVMYKMKHPDAQGRDTLFMSGIEFIDRVAKLIPPPRVHRHRHFGVLAPNSHMRRQVIATAGPAPAITMKMEQAEVQIKTPQTQNMDTTKKRKSYTWAMLLARIYEVMPLLCPRCHQPMSLISFITAPSQIQPILVSMHIPVDPPQVKPAICNDELPIFSGPGPPRIHGPDPERIHSLFTANPQSGANLIQDRHLCATKYNPLK